MRHIFGILSVTCGLLAGGTISAQQLAGPAVASTGGSPTGPRLVGTGLVSPGALMYGAPVAGLRQAPALVRRAPSAAAISAPGITVVTSDDAPADASAKTSTASPLACIQLAARVEAEITKTPSDVLPIVRRALVDNDACACDIVKAAIVVSKADDDLTGAIVETAVKTQPSRYKEIVECAIMVKPGAKAQVRAALERVFGTKGSGKAGNVVVAKVEEKLPVMMVKEIPQMFFPPPPPPYFPNIPTGTPSNPELR